jgi:hypothetical protein
MLDITEEYDLGDVRINIGKYSGMLSYESGYLNNSTIIPSIRFL